MRLFLHALAAVSLLLPAFGACAQQAPFQLTPQQQEALQARWNALDRNHDGYLTSAEVADAPALSSRFEQLDLDRDARLSQRELRTSTENHLRAADINSDGAIDREEAEAGLPRVARFFDWLDADGDGRLTSDEVQRVASAFAGRRAR